MEDDNSLQLSLGLFCGPSSSHKSKSNSSDLKTDDGRKQEANVGSLNATMASLGPLYPPTLNSNNINGEQRQESFWKVLGQPTAVLDDGHRYPQVWGVDDNMDASENRSGQSKRKMPFEDVNILKKPEKGRDELDVGHKGLSDRGPKSHISVNSEDGSSAENEAVGESETEASNSWLVSQHKDLTSGSEAHNFSDPNISRNSDPPSQGKGPSSLLVHESRMVNAGFSYGIRPSLQPGSGTAMPVKSPITATASNATGTPLSGIMQLNAVPGAAGSSISHAVKSNTLHLSSFGYQSVQLPTLETNASWMFGPPLDRKNPTDAWPSSSHTEDKLKALQATAFEGKTFDQSKGSGKHAEEAGTSSSQPDEEADGNKASFRPKISSVPNVEGFPSEGSVIRPGIAPGLKFGGSGSYPDLPWVSVTGSGPNGKTISGVTYKFSKNQIKIVCACHGQHMSPEEFIQHANAGNPGGDNTVGIRNGSPAASAQS